MADYHIRFSVMFPVGSARNVAPALALYRRLAKELSREDQTIDFAARADDEPGSPEL